MFQEVGYNDVVCFKTLGGAQIVGKVSDKKTHKDFLDHEDVIYLDDAVFLGTSERGLGMAPITDIGAGQEQTKPQVALALYRSAIMAQVPLDEEIIKIYREKTSGILLAR